MRKLPVFATFGGSAGVDQKFNRFDLSLKGDAERTAYQQSQLTDGTTASNDDRNFDQYGGTLRGAYELSPGVTPFVEFGTDTRVHDLNTDFSGYAARFKGPDRPGRHDIRDIETAHRRDRARLHQARLRGPAPEDAAGLIGDASLVWTATALTTVKLTGASTVGELTEPGVSGVLYRDVGLQVDHAFRRWLIGSVKLGVGWDIYQGSEVDTSSGAVLCDCGSRRRAALRRRVDKRYSAGVGITYKLDRTTQIKGEFRQDWLRSNVSGVDYTASTVLLGVRFQR